MTVNVVFIEGQTYVLLQHIMLLKLGFDNFLGIIVEEIGCKYTENKKLFINSAQ